MTKYFDKVHGHEFFIILKNKAITSLDKWSSKTKKKKKIHPNDFIIRMIRLSVSPECNFCWGPVDSDKWRMPELGLSLPLIDSSGLDEAMGKETKKMPLDEALALN